MRAFSNRLAACVLFAANGFAADLEIRYGALERLLAEQMFTVEGRRYVRGDQSARCSFAYLESPKLAASGTNLQMQVHFNGRSALNLMGGCVGMGDAFDVTITAQPVPRDGAIGFEQLVVNTPRDSYYIRRVRTALIQSFDKNFRIDIREQARRLLEAPRGGSYEQELKDLRLSGIRVTADALVLGVDFKLIVK
jgi:hypothetical protein